MFQLQGPARAQGRNSSSRAPEESALLMLLKDKFFSVVFRRTLPSSFEAKLRTRSSEAGDSRLLGYRKRLRERADRGSQVGMEGEK